MNLLKIVLLSQLILVFLLALCSSLLHQSFAHSFFHFSSRLVLKTHFVHFQFIYEVIFTNVFNQFLKNGLNSWVSLLNNLRHFTEHYITHIFDSVTFLNALELEKIYHGNCVLHIILVCSPIEKEAFDFLNFFVGKSFQNAIYLKEGRLFNLFDGFIKRILKKCQGLSLMINNYLVKFINFPFKFFIDFLWVFMETVDV